MRESTTYGRPREASAAPVLDSGQPWLIDRFDSALPAGKVIGTRADSGHRRLGRDPESALSVDNGALRVRYLRDPGWGRASLVYGPFQPQPGLCFAVTMVNGLPTSQTDILPEGKLDRVARMVRTFPRVRRPELHENLAVGWFNHAVPPSPLSGGACFVTHSHPQGVAELWATGDEAPAPVVHGLQNLPITYVVVLRHGDAALYAMSVPGAHGLGHHPSLRPLGIVPLSTEQPLYAGIHQAVLGEVRYELDSRIHLVQVRPLPEFSSWFGSAHLADLLTSEQESPARSLQWDHTDGLETTSAGTIARRRGVALATTREPTGLIRATVRSLGSSPIVLRWRGDDDGHWWIELDGESSRVGVTNDGRREVVAVDAAHFIRSDKVHSIQVLDDGTTVGAFLDGHQLFDAAIADRRGVDGREIGFEIRGRGSMIRRFEAHPRALPIPSGIDPGGPWSVEGSQLRARDSFDGPPRDLDGRSEERAGRRWRRVFGQGRIDVTGATSARVRANRSRPNPGRTIYVLPWDGRCVDTSVTITSPGRQRGEAHRGRGGLCLWEDAGNHLVVNTWNDDSNIAVSISAFLRIHGHEVMRQHDATWTNVGLRIRPGVPFRLRLVSDGLHFTCFVDGEPVLYRRLTDYRADARPLTIRGVGIVANWEWGDDTGSTFQHFEASGDV